MPYLSVPRIGNKFRELVNNPADLAAHKNLRDYKRYMENKDKKPDATVVTITPETSTHVSTLIAADKERVAARNAARAAAATAEKPFVAPEPLNYKDLDVMIKLVCSNIYRNTKEFNVGVTGLINDVLTQAIVNATASAGDAKSLDFHNSFAVGNGAGSFWSNFAHYSETAPDLAAKPVLFNQETNIKSMFKKYSSLPVKKDLIRQVNGLVFDILDRCAEYSRILSAYNNKKTLTKNTAVAITNLINKSSLTAVNGFEAYMTAEDAADKAAAEARKSAPKVPKTADVTPAATTPAAPVVTASPAGKGKGKGKNTTAESPAVSSLLAAAVAASPAVPAGKGKGKGKGKNADTA